MSKSGLQTKAREAASSVLQPNEQLGVIFTAQVGMGYWPFLALAGVLTFFISLAIPDSTGKSITIGLIFGLAFLTWMLISRPHAIVLTDRRLLLFPLTLTNRVQGPPLELPLASITRGGPLTGLGWLKLVLERETKPPIRLTLPSAWRREAEALIAALN